MSDTHPTGTTNYVQSWDPLSGEVLQQLRGQQQQVAARLPMKPARLRRRLALLILRAQADPMGAAFIGVSVLGLIAAAAAIAVGWPVTGDRDATYVGVVVGAASATAFGSIVFSVASTLFSRATEIAPGYSAVVLGRRSPWLSGLGIVVVAALLFLFAAFDPTLSGAIAAVALTLSAVCWSWSSARKTLADSDPLVVAQAAGRYYRTALKRSVKYGRWSLAVRWPREVRRDKEFVQQLTLDHQRDIAIGLLRQIRSGVRSTAGQGRATEAVTLFEALTESFAEFAKLVDGAIGRHDSLLDVVLTAADAVMDASLQQSNNEVGNHSLKLLANVGTLQVTDPDYAAARSLVAQRLKDYLDRTWDDDVSTVPANAISTLGGLAEQWVAGGAHDDGRRALEDLSKVAIRATTTRRIHLGIVATEQLAKLLPTMANVQPAQLREHHLSAWTEAVTPLMTVAPLEPLDHMYSACDALLPGISLAPGADLQQCFWSVSHDASTAATTAVLDGVSVSFDRLVSDNGRSLEPHEFERAIADTLSLVYGVTVLLAAHSRDDAVAQAERAVYLGVRATIRAQDERGYLSADVAELAWSVFLAARTAGLHEEKIATSATELIEELGLRGRLELAPIDRGFMVAFGVGLQVLAGIAEADIDAWVSSAQGAADPFSGIHDWGLRIEGLGRAPSANRNRVAAPPVVIDEINRRAVQHWPQLAASDSDSGRPGSGEVPADDQDPP